MTQNYEDVLKLHIEIFGKTLARVGMTKDYEYAMDYPLYLISHDGIRWMLDKYLEACGCNAPDVGKVLDRLNDEYNDYLDWTDTNKEARQGR